MDWVEDAARELARTLRPEQWQGFGPEVQRAIEQAAYQDWLESFPAYRENGTGA